MTRTKYRLSPSEITGFEDAVHLFFANRFVKEHNRVRLRDLGTPVVAIHAEHDTPVAAEVGAGQLLNLEGIVWVPRCSSTVSGPNMD